MTNHFVIKIKNIIFVKKTHSSAFFSQNFNTVQDRFDPEMRQTIGTALQTYSRHSRRLNAIDTSVQNLRRQVQESFPEYL